MRGRAHLAAAVGAILIAGCGGAHTATQAHPSVRTATRPVQSSVRTLGPLAAVPRVLRGQIPDRLPTKRHVVALTFDAGANDAGAPKILSVLARTGATATFFMTGRWAELYPGWARRIVAHYPIANHTFNHHDLLGLTLPEVRDELLSAAATITRVTGGPPIHLFRFPYGSSNGSTLDLVNRLGYTAVGWTVDTLGWRGASAADIVNRSLRLASPGALYVLHVGHTSQDGPALARIVTSLRERGYGFVAVDSLPL